MLTMKIYCKFENITPCNENESNEGPECWLIASTTVVSKARLCSANVISFFRSVFTLSDRLMQFVGPCYHTFVCDRSLHFGRRCGLFRCRARRRIRLPRRNGTLWHVTHCHEADRL